MITSNEQPIQPSSHIIVGAEQLNELLPILKDKRIGLVINQTSTVGNTLLLDTLVSLGVNITATFAPEHGVRGQADAGAKVANEIDIKTGVPILSIYGKNKKPSVEQLKNIDIIVFDIQDVGARFYTYISTLHYVMEAAAENFKQVIVLDRPNPNGHYVDGPILETEFASFVGMHPIPIVHGMTIGEYAQMINGEKWLKSGVKCDLKIIKMKNYDHQTFYFLPIPPSPNLPNMKSIYLYPSLCLFEGTPYSVGRGTSAQFQLWGHPLSGIKDTIFTPESRPGATQPPLLGKKSYGKSYTKLDIGELQHFGFSLQPILEAYHSFQGENFFTPFFLKLTGTRELEEQIKAGLNEEEIKQSWQDGLDKFKKIRKKYLLYNDFE
ncbi:MAG: DUF1343 domain-containing protein [Chitinophagales bacterium]|nr:DUF1343 domain-containing protein [Chitinophagales bacterium]MCZ2394325.1 DUF1343 domain-containing protein [Chitinophagales bacterium]